MVSESDGSVVNLSLELQQCSPLWQRVPKRTHAGEYVADFMMIIRDFNRQSGNRQELIANHLYAVFKYYDDVILFVDFNIKINLLWVSHRPRPGIGLEVAAMIHDRIPEARLITHYRR